LGQGDIYFADKIQINLDEASNRHPDINISLYPGTTGNRF
jgi:hypothetical protein